MIVNGIVFLICPSNILFLVYRNAIDFCILILYLAASLNLFIISISFGVESLGLYIYIYIYISILLSANSDSFTFSPSVWMAFIYIYFSCLMAVTRTFTSMLNKYGENGYSALFLILEEKLSALYHYDISCESVIIGLCNVDVFFLYTHFVVFIMNLCFQMIFLHQLG